MSAEEFRAWLLERGLSVHEAAALFGYSPRQISNFKAGISPVGRRVELAMAELSRRLKRRERKGSLD